MQPVVRLLLPNGDGPVVLRLIFCIMVIGLYEFGHISLDSLVVQWQWVCMNATDMDAEQEIEKRI